MIRHLWLLCLLPLSPLYAQNVLFQETVTTLLPFPPGWQATRWTVTTQTPSSGSGGNSFALQGQEGDRLCSPVLDVTQAALTQLTYWARRTASYPSLHLVVRASIDGGQTFPYVIAPAGQALPQTDGSWVRFSFALPNTLSGRAALQLCFDALGGQSSSARLQLDDITLYGTGTLSRPPFVALPPAVHAGFVAPGDTVSIQLILRNQTDSALTIALPPLPTPWLGQPNTRHLTAGSTDTLQLAVAPSAEGSWFDAWALRTGAFTYIVHLSATAELPNSYLGLLPVRTTALALDTLTLALRLRWDAPLLPMQGLQLQLELPAIPWLNISIRPGASLPNASNWTLQLAQQGRNVTLLMLDNVGAGLAPNDYPELLRLQLVAADVGTQVSGKVILKELRATAATPEATLITLARYPRAQRLTIRPRLAYIRILADTLRLGPTAVGSSRTTALRIVNPGGLRSVRLWARQPLDPTLRLLPDSLDLAPNDTAALMLTFHPTLRDFGWRTTTLRLRHNATEGDSLVVVEALGTGGLGDPTEDGRVDVADLQRSIRYVLGLTRPDGQDRLVLDVAPFPQGDGQLHLEDIVLLAQAIARDTWPDGHPLPVPPPTLPQEPGKNDTPIVLYLLADGPDQLRLQVESTVAFGALQLTLPRAASLRYDSTTIRLPAHASLQLGQPEGRITLVLYRLDGQPFPAGSYALGLLHGTDADTRSPLRWIAVSPEERYLPTQVRTSPPEEMPLELPQQVLFLPPYPQPFFPEHHQAVVFSGRLPAPASLTGGVFDLLGRQLYMESTPELPAGHFTYLWKGQDAYGRRVAAGLYLVRLQLPNVTRTFPVIVSR